MRSSQGYGAMTAKAALQSFVFERRDVGPHALLIAIPPCGISYSDIHQARDEWGGSISTRVPGHEIVGIVAPVGSAVKKFKTNDRVGVGKCHKLAVVGLGGLGHMAVKIGKALGAEVTVLSTSERY